MMNNFRRLLSSSSNKGSSTNLGEIIKAVDPKTSKIEINRSGLADPNMKRLLNPAKNPNASLAAAAPSKQNVNNNEKFLDPNDEDDEDYVEMWNKDRTEWGGPRGKEPTRYGDWEKNGITRDF